MTDHHQTLEQAAQRLRVTPPRSAWKRIEARLETQQVRRYARFSRLFSYAAAIVVLVLLTAGGLYFLDKPELMGNAGYSHSLQDLEPLRGSEQSIFDIEKVQALSEIMKVRH